MPFRRKHEKRHEKRKNLTEQGRKMKDYEIIELIRVKYIQQR
jgi:hypothetical protein